MPKDWLGEAHRTLDRLDIAPNDRAHGLALIDIAQSLREITELLRGIKDDSNAASRVMLRGDK